MTGVGAVLGALVAAAAVVGIRRRCRCAGGGHLRVRLYGIHVRHHSDDERHQDRARSRQSPQGDGGEISSPLRIFQSPASSGRLSRNLQAGITNLSCTVPPMKISFKRCKNRRRSALSLARAKQQRAKDSLDESQRSSGVSAGRCIFSRHRIDPNQIDHRTCLVVGGSCYRQGHLRVTFFKTYKQPDNPPMCPQNPSERSAAETRIGISAQCV